MISDSQLAERIRRRLEELDRSPITAAVKGGLERSYLRDFLSGKKKSVKRENHEAIARGLDWTVNQLLGGAEIAVPADSISVTPSAPSIIAGRDLVGARDLPVYVATQGGNGHMIITFDPTEYVKRPTELEGVRDGYAIRVKGDSMAKAYRDGDLALVHPHLQPGFDEVHVFYDHDPRTGEAESIIKNLLSYTEDKWRLEQFNPDKKFSVDRVDWPICHRVVGKYNRR